MPYDLESPSIWNRSSSPSANISSGAGESLTIWHHMRLTISTELCGLTTHILVYLWGLLLVSGMTEKEITSLCYLSIFAWIFPTILAVHFLAFAFLAITFWSKECVITGIKGFMSSWTHDLWQCDWHSVQDEEHVLLDCPHNLLAFAHSTTSWSSHLNIKKVQVVWWLFWTNQIYVVWPLLWLSA